jgi:hypothetical protein
VTDVQQIASRRKCSVRQVNMKERPSSGGTRTVDRKVLQDSIARIDVHEDHLAIRLKSADDEEISSPADNQLLSIPWQKPPSRRSRQILLPHGVSRSEVRPTRIGIFGCRDGRLKSASETANCHRRLKEQNDTGEYPRETARFDSARQGARRCSSVSVKVDEWDRIALAMLSPLLCCCQRRRPRLRWITDRA